jgi:hypothetical protein
VISPEQYIYTLKSEGQEGRVKEREVEGGQI